MFSSHADHITADMFRKAVLQTNTRRKEDAAKKLAFFNDEQSSFILAQINAFYKQPERVLPVSVNIVRKIIKALSTVYLNDAVRTVTGTKQDQDILAAIDDTASLPVKMKLANRYSKLLGTILLRPVWRNGTMDIDVLTPDILDVYCADSPEYIKAVMVTQYSDSGKNTEVEYSLWTPEVIQRLDYRYNLISEEPNPYLTLPFVAVFSSPPTDTYWLPGANDLVLIQDAVNKRLSDLWFTLDYQSAGVFFVKGAKAPTGKAGTVADISVGPSSAIYLPEHGEVGFAAPKAPVQDTLDAIERLMKWAALTNGLPAGSMSLDPTVQSGVSRIVANSELSELRMDDIAHFARVECQLFDIIRVVWNTHNTQRKISEAASLTVDFYDPKPVVSPADKVKEWQGLLELGLISLTDILIERNPDLTREDAQRELLRIRDENTEFQNLNLA